MDPFGSFQSFGIVLALLPREKKPDAEPEPFGETAPADDFAETIQILKAMGFNDEARIRAFLETSRDI